MAKQNPVQAARSLILMVVSREAAKLKPAQAEELYEELEEDMRVRGEAMADQNAVNEAEKEV